GAGALAGGTWLLASAKGQATQTAARPSEVHAALNSGIDSYRRADYESADQFFRQAQAKQKELTAGEGPELDTLRQLNGGAMKGRQEGFQLLRQVEEAVAAGRTADAEAYLRAMATNQFLSADDRGRAQELAEQLGIGGLIVRGQS